MNKAFLKWAGGKGQLVDKILSLMPLNKPVGRYIEPFVGSGIMALNVPDVFKEIVIGDTNWALIAVWNSLQDHGEQFIFSAKQEFVNGNDSKNYYFQREFFNGKAISYYSKAVLFLYLNRHAFNGLCRFNSKGEFNVPFGQYKTVYFPEKELLYAIEVTKRMRIYHTPFQDTMSIAQAGDVIYCDPPYIPVSKTSNFTAYDKNGFMMEDHQNLARAAEVARVKGATVIISNNDTPAARKLYKNATEIHSVDVRKSIGASAATRKKQGEIIAVYRPK